MFQRTIIGWLGLCLIASCAPSEPPIADASNNAWVDISHVQDTQATARELEAAAYASLRAELNVRTKQHLIMCTPTPDGIAAADRFLQQYPNSDNRATVMYLAAIARWNAYRYADAAEAYRAFLESYPNHALAGLSRSRLIQSFTRSDQTEAAIEAADTFTDLPGAEQRDLLRADALALGGRADEAVAILQAWITLDFANGNDRVLARAQQQLDRIELIGQPLKHFDVTAFGSGEGLSPATFRGRVLLIDFWASWCRPCMAQLPHLAELYQRWHSIEGGLDILGVCLDEHASRMTRAQNKVGATWPQFFDGKKWKNALAVQFDVHRIPAVLLVDRDGIVRAVDPPPAAVDRLVAELLGKPATAHR